jgi:hypothetical protein
MPSRGRALAGPCEADCEGTSTSGETVRRGEVVEEGTDCLHWLPHTPLRDYDTGRAAEVKEDLYSYV